MANKRVPEGLRKVPHAVSLTAAERTVFKYLGGSAYLQGNLLARARSMVDGGAVKGEVRQAAQDILNAHATRGMPRLILLRTNQHLVLAKHPKAVCKRDPSHKGPGVSYVIFTTGVAARMNESKSKFPGSWMTPWQAWERAAHALNLKG